MKRQVYYALWPNQRMLHPNERVNMDALCGRLDLSKCASYDCHSLGASRRGNAGMGNDNPTRNKR
jgi:hypothetical protein